VGGSLSSMIGQLTSLVYVSLYQMGFVGTVPSQISELTNLEYLCVRRSEYFFAAISDLLSQRSDCERVYGPSG
jgi:hypothetical protein